jgi:hypothetical protein
VRPGDWESHEALDPKEEDDGISFLAKVVTVAVLSLTGLTGGTPYVKDRPLSKMQRLQHACGQYNVVPCIEFAAIKYDQSPGVAICDATRESTLHPWSSNGPWPQGHHGLYQFNESAWDLTRYRRHSVFSARWDALAAMALWKKREYSRWAETYYDCV